MHHSWRMKWGSLLLLTFGAVASATDQLEIHCEGRYKHHLQGICADGQSMYWSFTTSLVKTDLQGKVLQKRAVANHHGDLCFHSGKIYVAVNLGQFNHPQGKADSWVYVYDAKHLKELQKIEVQQVFHGAGGIGVRNDHFFVVGGLPEGVKENYVYEFDEKWKFIKKHIVHSGHTHLGIQTAAFSDGKWYFGCYGRPAELLVTDQKFKLLGRFQYNCSLGIEDWKDGQLLSAAGSCDQKQGCNGRIRNAVPDIKLGLKQVADKARR